MKRLLPFVMTVMSANCAFMANAETFTAADFTGDDKFCTQLFYGTEMVGERIQEGAWGRFEAVDGDASKIRLSSFKNGGSVVFTIEGDKLSLDGTENINEGLIPKNGVSFIDHDGKEIHLYAVKHGKYNLGKNHYFIEKKAKYSGTIARDGNGNITVSFADPTYDLQFRRRNDDLNADAVWTDYVNTFKRIEFRIYDSNGVMNNGSFNSILQEQSPLTVNTYSDNGDNVVFLLQNFAEAGEHFYNEQSSYFLTNGIQIVVNKVNKGYEMPKQQFSGKIEPTRERSLMGAGESGGRQTMRVKDMRVGNYWVAGVDDGDVNGNYSVVSRNINPGWH